MTEILMYIAIGFCIRILILGILMSFTKLKTIALHPVLGVAAVIHYAWANEAYSHMSIINMWTVIGFVLLELIQLPLMTIKKGK